MKKQEVTVLATEDAVWFESHALIEYLRFLQHKYDEPNVSDALRQIADGLVITTILASDVVMDYRESHNRY